MMLIGSLLATISACGAKMLLKWHLFLAESKWNGEYVLNVFNGIQQKCCICAQMSKVKI